MKCRDDPRMFHEPERDRRSQSFRQELLDRLRRLKTARLNANDLAVIGDAIL